MTLKIKIKNLEIPFVTGFKHASAERLKSCSLWVEASRGGFTGFGEGCPRPYVTGEDLKSAIDWSESIKLLVEGLVHQASDLKRWHLEYSDLIDAHPAAWCAIELALLDLFAREEEKTVEELLGLSPVKGPFQYSAVITAGSTAKVREMIDLFHEKGFSDYKFKISGDAGRDRKGMISLLGQPENGGPFRIRIDANNHFKSLPQSVDYIRTLNLPLFAVEEPLQEKNPEILSEFSTQLNLPVILDECLIKPGDISKFAGFPGEWIANIRVSKSGGLIRALELVKEAKRNKCKIIVGAHVGETSVLTRAALPVAQAAGENLVAQEGAFGTLLLAHDKVAPEIHFSRGGILEYPGVTGISQTRGWGLTIISQ